MKVSNLLTAVALSSASMFLSTEVLAANPNNISGVYKFSVCGGQIHGMANLSSDGSVAIIDDNESSNDTATIGVWDKNGQSIRGKAVFYREPYGEVEMTITKGQYQDSGNITGTLNLPTVSCPDLLLVPYNLPKL